MTRRLSGWFLLLGILFAGWSFAIAEEEDAVEKKIRIDFKAEPAELARAIKEVIHPGLEVYEVARKIKFVLWEGEQRHPLRHTSKSYFFDGSFHGEGHIPVIVGREKLMSRGWKEFEITAIFIFDGNKVLEDVFVKRRQVSF